MDTSSLLEILQGYFGHVDSSESTESVEETGHQPQKRRLLRLQRKPQSPFLRLVASPQLS